MHFLLYSQTPFWYDVFIMNPKALDALATFCYDCAKITFAVLVIGAVVSRATTDWTMFLAGIFVTSIFVISALILHHWKREDK